MKGLWQVKDLDSISQWRCSSQMNALLPSANRLATASRRVCKTGHWQTHESTNAALIAAAVIELYIMGRTSCPEGFPENYWCPLAFASFGGWMNGALWTNQVEMLPIAQKLWHQSKWLRVEASTKAMNNGSTLPVLLLMRNKTTESDEWLTQHGDVIEWKHFLRYCPFVRGIHRSPVNSPHKGQWRGALVFSLICAWINRWVNNGEAGDLRLHCAHCDVIVMMQPNCAIWRHRTCSKSDHAVDF